MSWIELSDTKTFLWISWTDLDNRINLIIPWVQAIIEWIIWDISTSDKTDNVKICDITDLWEVYLNYWNITALKKINWVDYTWTLDTDYMINSNKLTINDIAQYLTNLNFNYVKIVYTAWFSAIPADIKEIMYILVWQELNKKEGSIIKSYTLWPRSVTLDNTNWDADWLINSINSILWKYKIFNI